ncbi:unnamed protein product, partial [Leptidea sinapis]
MLLADSSVSKSSISNSSSFKHCCFGFMKFTAEDSVVALTMGIKNAPKCQYLLVLVLPNCVHVGTEVEARDTVPYSEVVVSDGKNQMRFDIT